MSIHEQIVQAFNNYVAEQESFETKEVFLIFYMVLGLYLKYDSKLAVKSKSFCQNASTENENNYFDLICDHVR